MTEQPPTTIPEAIDAFSSVRGVPDDATWAGTAAARFLLDDVPDELVATALREASQQVAESGESPQELWGDPVTWAREQEGAWRSEGVGATTPSAAVTSLRDLALGTLIGASAIAVLFFVVEAISWTWTRSLSVPLLLAPLVLSACAHLVRAVYERVLRTRSFGIAVAMAAGALLVVAPAVAAFFLGTRDQVVAEASILWLLAVGAGYGLLGALVAWVWPAPPPHSTSPVPQEDEVWLAELAAALRQRGDMTDERVRQVVAETRQHAQDAGQPLEAEFGAPAAYAARFAKDDGVASRRVAWFWTVLTVVPAAFLAVAVIEDGSVRVWTVLWPLATAWLAVSSWRRASRSSGPRDVTGSTYR